MQEILAEDLPLICLASPDVLVGAKDQVANFKPAMLDPHALWNSQELFLRGMGMRARNDDSSPAGEGWVRNSSPMLVSFKIALKGAKRRGRLLLINIRI